MTHDPLCAFVGIDVGGTCGLCDLITKVRNQERSAVTTANKKPSYDDGIGSYYL